MTDRRVVQRAQRRARWHEFRLTAASHPVAAPLLNVVGRLGEVVPVPGWGYLVNDASLAREILNDDRAFSKRDVGNAGKLISELTGYPDILNGDDDQQQRVRRGLQGLFTGAFINELIETMVEPLGRDAAQRLDAGQTIDLVRLAKIITGRVACHLLAVNPRAVESDTAALRAFELGERLVAGAKVRTQKSPVGPTERRMFDELVGNCHGKGTGSSLSVRQRLIDLDLSAEEAASLVATLFIVGTQTTATALPRTVALLIDSMSWEQLRSEPSRLSQAVDEALRYTTPSPASMRRVVESQVVGGHRFTAGRRVVILTANAVRNLPRAARPRDFDIGRGPEPRVRNIWFGSGPHSCLGMPLARAELISAIGTLLSLPKDLRIVKRKYARAVLIPAYDRLEVMLDPSGKGPLTKRLR